MRQLFFRHIAARFRGHLSDPNQYRKLQLREYAALPKDVPWSPPATEFTPEDLKVLHWLRQELNHALGPTDIITDADLVYLALRELELALRAERENEILKLRFYLAENSQTLG